MGERRRGAAGAGAGGVEIRAVAFRGRTHPALVFALSRRKGRGATAAAVALAGAAYVALTSEGIVRRAGFLWSYVGWDAIETVKVVEAFETPVVGVTVRDPAAIETSFLGGLFLLSPGELAGVDVPYAASLARPDALADAIVHYLEHPEARARIGSADPARYTGSAVPR